MSLVKLRSITPKDIPALNELLRAGKAYWGYSEEGLDRFMDAFKITEKSFESILLGSIMIDKSEKDIIGYYVFKSEDGEPMLDHFILDTKEIGKGFGRLMWDTCIREAKQAGVSKFFFWSDPNTEAFYKHMGAVKIGERPMITLPGSTAPIMEYRIQ